MKKIIICKPDFFNISYEINPWMKKTNLVNKEIARKQHETMLYAYRSLGIKYEGIIANELYPDQVYTTDVGHAENGVFIPANYKYKERQGERDLAVNYFKNEGFEVKNLPENVYFEGGDFLKIEDKYFLGYGKRTSKNAAKEIEKIIGKKVYLFELKDDYFYHLDTCFSPLDEKTAVINKKAHTKENLDLIYEMFENIIETNDEDNKYLACNFVKIKDSILVAKGVTDEFKDKIISAGYIVMTVDVTEFLKAGGSIHCMSLEVF